VGWGVGNFSCVFFGIQIQPRAYAYASCWQINPGKQFLPDLRRQSDEVRLRIHTQTALSLFHTHTHMYSCVCGGADTATAAAAGDVSNHPDLGSLIQNLLLQTNLLCREGGAKRERMLLRALRRIRPVDDSIDHEYDTHDGRISKTRMLSSVIPRTSARAAMPESRSLTVE